MVDDGQHAIAEIAQDSYIGISAPDLVILTNKKTVVLVQTIE